VPSLEALGIAGSGGRVPRTCEERPVIGRQANYLTYRERADAMCARFLRNNPRLKIQIKPFVSPEKKPARACGADGYCGHDA
jgi:hypothetical protein